MNPDVGEPAEPTPAESADRADPAAPADPASPAEPADSADPAARARRWVARFKAAPVLDGYPLTMWLVTGELDAVSLAEDQLVDVLSRAFARFDALEADAHPRRLAVPQDGSVESRAMVLWARARGVEPVDERGRSAMAKARRPSWWRGWLRYRWGRGLPPELAAHHDGRRAALAAWREGMAVWESLGRSEAFRDIFITDDGIDLAVLVLPVLAEAVERAYPEAVGRAAIASRPHSSPREG